MLASVNLERGDTLSALENSHRGLARVLGLAAIGRVSVALGPLADAYRQLGLFGDARSFVRRTIDLLEHSPGEVAGWTHWLGARDTDEQRIEAAVARYESAVSLYRAAAAAEHGPHLRAQWLRDAASVLHDNLAPLEEPRAAEQCFEAAEDLLARAARAADEANSPEQRALTRQSRAFLARARKQWDRAETELLAFLAWAETAWGPFKRAEVERIGPAAVRERASRVRAGLG